MAIPTDPFNKHKTAPSGAFGDLDLSDLIKQDNEQIVKQEIEYREQTGEKRHDIAALSGISTAEEKIEEDEDAYSRKNIQEMQIEAQNAAELLEMEKLKKLETKEQVLPEDIALKAMIKRHNKETKALEKNHQTQWNDVQKEYTNEKTKVIKTHKQLEKDLAKEHVTNLKDLKKAERAHLSTLNKENQQFFSEQRQTHQSHENALKK
jgi:hypothetical protein